jgi:hypothetical protein
MSLLGKPLYRKIIVLIVIAVGMCLSVLTVVAQPATEQEVKAVFIYNFISFVEWPAATNAKDEFVIGVAAPETFSNLLTKVVQGETVQGKSIRVQLIASPEQARTCQIVFIDRGHKDLDGILRVTDELPTLTVADHDEFMQKGGVIRFFMQENKVRLEINADAAKSHHLKISAKLLRLASLYKP